MDVFERIIPKIGEWIGRYQVTGELGRGGFGVVYRARQQGLEVDVVKVLDFGIAKVAVSDSDVRTQTGMRSGTSWYMAPEQALGQKQIDGRLDLYAFGLIMAECLSGRRVLQADDMMSALTAQAEPTPLAFEPAVTESPLFPIIEVAPQKSPNHRFESAVAMREALDDVAFHLRATRSSGHIQPLPRSQPPITAPAVTPMPPVGPSSPVGPPVPVGRSAPVSLQSDRVHVEARTLADDSWGPRRNRWFLKRRLASASSPVS